MGGGCRLGPASAFSYAFVRQKHLPVAGAGSRHDAAEVFLLRSTQPAELSGQVGGLSHHPALESSPDPHTMTCTSKDGMEELENPRAPT